MQSVTVFPQKAQVERVFEWSVERAGETVVRVGPLPLGVERDSMQVLVVDGEVEVQGLEMRLQQPSHGESARSQELKAELDAARQSARQLQTTMVGIESRQEVLSALIRAAAEVPEPELDAFMQNIATRSMELDQERASLEGKIQLQAAAIEAMEREYAASTSSARPYQEILLPLRFASPGTAQFRLLYLVPNASWEPSYELRVATDLTGVAMSQVARVRQSTGEDWDSVSVLLSTAMPSRGLAPPILPRRFYQLPYTNSPDLDGLAGEAYRAGAGNPSRLRSSDDGGDGTQSSGVLAQFPIAGARTVRSNGEVARFELASLPLDVRPERYIVPSVSDQAWLRAEIRYNGSDVLIPGRAKVYLGGDLLGETEIPLMTTGARTLVNLGPDPNLDVRFQLVADERREPGLLSSTARITRSFLADVRLDPTAPAPVRILVEESLPRSRDERVTIKPVRLQPAPMDDADSRAARDQGIYRWRFELAPGATRRITWGYEAAFDEDLDPILMEREGVDR